MNPYLDQFEAGVKDDVVMLGSISLDEVQEEEKHLRDEHVEYLEQEAADARERQQELLRKEEEAKKRVAMFTQLKREEIQRREVRFTMLYPAIEFCIFHLFLWQIIFAD